MGKAKLRFWFSKLNLKSSPNSTERSPTATLCSSSPPPAAGDDRQSQVHNVLLLTPVRSSRSSSSLQGTTYHAPPCSASGPAFSPISPLRLRPSAAHALMMLRSPARPPVSRIASSSSSANPRPGSKKHIRHVSRSSLPMDCGCYSFSRMSRYQAMTQEQLNESAVICMKMEGGAVQKWKKKKKRKKKTAEDRWVASAMSAGYGGHGDEGVTDRRRKDSYAMDRAERNNLRQDQYNMAMPSSKIVLRSLSILSKEGRGLDSHPLLWDSSFTSEETLFSSFDRDRHRRSFSSSNSSSSEGIKQTSVVATEGLKQSSDRTIKQSNVVSADGFFAADGITRHGTFSSDRIEQNRVFFSEEIKQDRVFSSDGIKQTSDVFDASNFLDRFRLSDDHPHLQNSSFAARSYFLQRASPTPPPSDFRCDFSSAAPAPSTGSRANWIAALDGIASPVIRPGFRKDLRDYGDLHSFRFADASPVSYDGGRMPPPTVVNRNQATQCAGTSAHQQSFAKVSSSVYNRVRRDHSTLYSHPHESNISAMATEDSNVPKWAEFGGDSLAYSNLMSTEHDNGDITQTHQDTGPRVGDRYRRTSDDSDLFHCLQMKWSQMNENKADESSSEDESERDGRRTRGGCEATLRSEGGLSLAEIQDVGGGGCCGNSGSGAGQCGSSSAGGCRWRVAESLAVVKSSRDPIVDFRDSMVDMILENDICSAEDMEELLRCFLSLNSQEHHATIVKAFAQVWQAVFDE